MVISPMILIECRFQLSYCYRFFYAALEHIVFLVFVASNMCREFLLPVFFKFLEFCLVFPFSSSSSWLLINAYLLTVLWSYDPMFVQCLSDDSFCFSCVGVSWVFFACLVLYCSSFIEDVDQS